MSPAIRFLFCVLLILCAGGLATGESNCCLKNDRKTALAPEELKKFLNDLIPGLMSDEHIPGVAVVFVQDGRVVLSQGFGYADLKQKKSVEPGKTIFPIGSVSKVFTATALVQLADRKKIDLKADVNTYLKKVRVPETYAQPITAANLLSHTSGLDEIRPGTQAESESKVLPLADFLKTRLVRVHPPGEITSYSTYGITLAGLLIEEMSGVSYEAYLNQNIWKPLQMKRTHISTPRELQPDVALGYAAEKDSPEEVAYEWYHTTPASSIRSTVEDMAHFLIAHLECGKFGQEKILSAASACSMLQTHATTHPEMTGWTYGFQEDDTNGLRILEHGGDVAGFGSLLVLLPEEHTGFFIVHHIEGANLRFAVKQKFLDRYFPGKRSIDVPTPTPDSRGALQRFVGLYRGNLFCHSCETSFPVAEVDVTANADGTITVWDQQWVEVRSLLFVSLDGKKKIGFQEDKSGRILQLSAGSWKVLEKVK